MRPAIISGLSAVALTVGSWAMPVVFPHVEPWVAKGMLWLSAGLLVLAFLIWLWGQRGANGGEPSVKQKTGGDGSHNLSGTFNGPVTFGAPSTGIRSEKKPQGAGDLALEELRKARSIEPSRSYHTPPTTKVLKPDHDMSLDEVITRVTALLGPVPTANLERQDYWIKVDQTISDKFANNGKLHSWGRLSLRRALQPIRSNHWSNGEFHHRRGTLEVQAPYGEPYDFIGLHFCKREIDEIWPEPRGTAND